MTTSVSSRRSSTEISPPAAAWLGRHGEDDLVLRQRLEDAASGGDAPPRRFRARARGRRRGRSRRTCPRSRARCEGRRDGAGTRTGAAARGGRPAPSRRRASSVPASTPSSAAATSSSSCSSAWSMRCALRYSRRPASVGSTRRPERSSSCWPRRSSRALTCRLTAGCVTPEPLGGLGEALTVDDGAEGRQLTGVHIRTPYSWLARVRAEV